MEQNVRERGAENEELSMTRDVKEKAARQKRRDTKAASRMSLATTPGSRTPSSAMYPPSSNQTSNPVASDSDLFCLLDIIELILGHENKPCSLVPCRSTSTAQSIKIGSLTAGISDEPQTYRTRTL
jgi:hypothetical protein